MPSLIANCLARLVKEGRVSPKAAKAAQALHDGMLGRLGEEMSPANADAVGALEAARIMGEQAKARKASIARQAIALVNGRERIAAHPRGIVAGLNAMLARDQFGKGGTNVDSLTEVIHAKLDAMFGPGNEALGVKFAGLKQDKALAREVVYENFGVDRGNQAARQISKGWQEATGYAATRAQQGGKLFSIADDWRQPQFWDSTRVGRVDEAAFTDDIMAEVNNGGLRLFDRETGGPAGDLQFPAIVKSAFHDITTGGGRGRSSGAFNAEMRVFRFAEGARGADAYLRLMDKYGPGDDYYSVMAGHLHGAAREIALIEHFGPDYRGTFRVLHDEATRAQKAGKAKHIPILNSAKGAEKTFKMLTGEFNRVENEALAGVMAGGRAWLTAVQLHSATLAAVPGDAATMALSSGYNGIPAARVIAKAIELTAADSATKRAVAARLGVTAYAASHSALTQARFADQWLDPKLVGRVADTAMRSTLLPAWTEAAKRAVTMEWLAKVADETGHAFKNVSPGFRAFLDRYQIGAKEWDALRKTPLLDVDGARFFDTTGVEDRALGEKLMGAIIDERHFFVLEPTAAERAILAPSANRGTLSGEVLRSFGMYKTFPVAMMTTHMMRAATQRNLSSKIGYGLALASLTTMFGALAIAAKDIAAGKDPRQMNSRSFWTAAMIQGGGTGILGDFIYQGVSRADSSFLGTVAGPLGGLVDVGAQLVFPTVRDLAAGDETNFGSTLARQMRRYLNPTPFYARLAVDRLFWDEVQTLIDPEYRRSFRRVEQNAKKFGQSQFWWRPGTGTPQRPPNVGNVIQ